MKNIKIGFLALLLTLPSHLFSQKNGENLIGKWQTEDKTIVEILKIGNSFSVKQISAINENEKVNIGKMIGKELLFNEKNEFRGIVIDPSNNKEYKALFTVAGDGKSLKLKVKWGFIGFNETWKRL